MGRKSLKEERQQEIVEAFYKVARKNGLANASIAKVADHLGINPSLVLHYFNTRDELFGGLIRYILEKYSGIYKATERGIANESELLLLIDNLFSRKWNDLFDDGVFYSCYAMVYQDKNIRRSFRLLHDSLRNMLVEALGEARRNNVLEIESEQDTADVIFALVEGAYYYLGMVSNKAVYAQKLKLLRNQALIILNLPVPAEV
ncbi:MAG: TetR/AcrR family transcriptional regulator [Bacteroidia bacterium]|nr:TetR/AcrR family transcriptional regulator [Bacteroidia bacterium]